MSFLSELERRAFDSRTADGSRPRSALLAVADDIDSGTLQNVRHVIVVVIMDGGDYDELQISQAGDLSVLATEGALHRAISISRDELSG